MTRTKESVLRSLHITCYFQCRKELFEKVHNFIHLNLAIALCLGYIVFVSGVDNAAVNRVQLMTGVHYP